MDNNIYQIERSIKRQIEFLTRHYYEDLDKKQKHADGSYMYCVDQHIIEGLEMAINIINLYK